MPVLRPDFGRRNNRNQLESRLEAPLNMPDGVCNVAMMDKNPKRTGCEASTNTDKNNRRWKWVQLTR